eukprot:9867960-Ditylum_brightwellii.AAC.1
MAYHGIGQQSEIPSNNEAIKHSEIVKVIKQRRGISKETMHTKGMVLLKQLKQMLEVGIAVDVKYFGGDK